MLLGSFNHRKWLANAIKQQNLWKHVKSNNILCPQWISHRDSLNPKPFQLLCACSTSLHITSHYRNDQSSILLPISAKAIINFFFCSLFEAWCYLILKKKKKTNHQPKNPTHNYNVPTSLQGKEKTEGVFSSDKLGNLYSLLEMPALVFLCLILSGTSAAISSGFYHQFSRQPPVSGPLLCELKAKSDGLTCLVQLCTIALQRVFWRDLAQCIFLVLLALCVKVKALNKLFRRFYHCKWKQRRTG